MCIRLYISVFFLFKQKTAYEMRISDWSSDVCSSDLASPKRGHAAGNGLADAPDAGQVGIENLCPILFRHIEKRRGRRDAGIVDKDLDRAELVLDPCDGRINAGPIGNIERSEEHTSELQSLMRISYAVFCLKKKKKQKNN